MLVKYFFVFLFNGNLGFARMNGFAFGAINAHNFIYRALNCVKGFFSRSVRFFLFPSEKKMLFIRNKGKKTSLCSYINFDVPSETIIATVIGGAGSLFWILVTLTAIFFTRVARVTLKKRYSTPLPFLDKISCKNLRHLHFLAIYMVIANSTISQANQILVFSNDLLLSSGKPFCIGVYPACLSLICAILVYPNKNTIRRFLAFPSILTCLVYLICSLSVIITSRINAAGILNSVISQCSDPFSMLCGIVSGCSAFSHVIYSDNHSNFHCETQDEECLNLSEAFFEYLSAIFSCLITGAALIASESFSKMNCSDTTLSFRKAEDAVIFSKTISYMFKSKKTVPYIAMSLSFINLLNDSCYQHRYFGFGSCEGSVKNIIIKKMLMIMPIAAMLIMRFNSLSVTPIIDATDILITFIITCSIPLCFLYLIVSFLLTKKNKLKIR